MSVCGFVQSNLDGVVAIITICPLGFLKVNVFHGRPFFSSKQKSSNSSSDLITLS